MERTLKNCPVCGAKAEIKGSMVETSHEWLEDVFWVQCENGHHVNTRSYVFFKKEDAESDWNLWDGDYDGNVD